MKNIIFLFFFCALFFVGFAQINTPWSTSGNAGTTDLNFIGTTDCKALIFKTGNKERMRLTREHSLLGIGLSNPKASLHVHYQFDIEICNDIGSLDGDDEDSTSTRGILGNKLLQLTTPATGFNGHNGFGIFSNASKEVTLRQQETANFLIEGPGGGLTIAPNGNIGVNTESPQAKLDVAGLLRATSANINGTFSVKESSNYTLSLGSAESANLGYGTSYIGFNATRNNGNWTLASDGANNGGAVIWSSVGGAINFAAIPSSSPSTGTQTLTDAQIKDHIKLKLTSDGKLKAKEVEVTLTGWSDYVFEKDYKLLTLSEVEQFIAENQHLPNVPSAAEVEANGINLGEMNAVLLQKIEELTLYIIQMEKRLAEVEGKKGGE